MSDLYRNYAHLEQHEKEGIDFKVSVRSVQNAPFVIVAPHGGGIELKTGPIAELIAAHDFSLYRFTGTKPEGGNKVLHITSHNFDEPRCLNLIQKHQRAITIHGCDDEGEKVFIGGLDEALIDEFTCALDAAELTVVAKGHSYPGKEPANICNLGATRKGVQFELTLTLRNSPQANLFANTVRTVLHSTRS